MNFFDEAIESKHDYLRKLRAKANRLRESAKGLEQVDVKTEIDIRKVIANQLADIRGLETANCYFWEPRITQMVLATGQQLPPDVKFQPSWLPGKKEKLMPRKPTVGYIVIGGHSPMGLGHVKRDKDVLFFGCAVTVFESRRRARRAIKATAEHRPDFESEFGLLTIRRCEAEKEQGS